MELDKTSEYDVVDGEAIKPILRFFFFRSLYRSTVSLASRHSIHM